MDQRFALLFPALSQPTAPSLLVSLGCGIDSARREGEDLDFGLLAIVRDQGRLIYSV